MSITDHWPSFSAHADCTLSRSLLMSSDERNWATALSRLCSADCRPLQLRLRNRISPHRPPVEGGQPCITDADNAVVQFIECRPLSNYDRSNSECQKTEFEFEFINQTSNFRTSFNNSSLDNDLDSATDGELKRGCVITSLSWSGWGGGPMRWRARMSVWFHCY